MVGASDLQIRRWKARQAKRLAAKTVDDGLLIHPDNILAVRLLLAMQTQWRVQFASTFSRVMPVTLGLKYSELETTARLEGLGEIAPDDFRRVRILEAEVLAVWGEERK